MKSPTFLNPPFGALVLAIALTSGCSKKETATVTTAPEEAVPAAQAPAPVAPAPAAAPATDPSASLAAAQAAMQKQDYERAAAALLSAQNQRQPLTAEQAMAVRNQMVQLQQNLAAGVASGDPKAKAAAEMLRRSTMR